jgi:hypothetical protein
MSGDDDELERESEVHRLAYEAGDKAALLLMIRHCFMLHWPVPEWAARAFADACSYVEMGGAASWDEVFGRPHPPGKHKRSLQLENRKYGIHRRVREIVDNEGCSIDDKLFERVGRETGLGGATVIKNAYYRVEKILHRVFGVTTMTMWRWDRDEAKAALGWPPKIKNGDRNYRSRNRLDAFKQNLIKAALTARAQVTA